MLKKLFIKDYKNVNNSNVRNKYGSVAGIFGIITNLILGIIKILIGLISNSVSIIADAINNISDMASSILTIIGFKLSNKKPDKEHPYGHARYEYIFGLLIAIFMLIVGVVFAKESLVKIINPQKLNLSIITFIILGISILLKILQMIVYLDFSKCINSKTLKTSAIDTRNDIISTSVILISMIIMYIYKVNIDGYLGLLVSLFVIYSSIKLIIEVMQPLIGVMPTKEFVSEISKKIMSYDNVIGFHDLVIHNYGVNKDFITVHLEVDSKLSLLEAHNLVDLIENDLKNSYASDAVIHIDPVVVGNKKYDDLRGKIKICLKEFDKELKLHDFRIVESKNRMKILFDCVVPHEKNYSRTKIVNYLKNNIKEDKDLEFIIEIDRPYS